MDEPIFAIWSPHNEMFIEVTSDRYDGQPYCIWCGLLVDDGHDKDCPVFSRRIKGEKLTFVNKKDFLQVRHTHEFTGDELKDFNACRAVFLMLPSGDAKRDKRLFYETARFSFLWCLSSSIKILANKQHPIKRFFTDSRQDEEKDIALKENALGILKLGKIPKTKRKQLYRELKTIFEEEGVGDFLKEEEFE